MCRVASRLALNGPRIGLELPSEKGADGGPRPAERTQTIGRTRHLEPPARGAKAIMLFRGCLSGPHLIHVGVWPGRLDLSTVSLRHDWQDWGRTHRPHEAEF